MYPAGPAVQGHLGAEPSTLDWIKKTDQTLVVPTASELEDVVRGADLRVTRPRVAVLAALHERPHADTVSLIAAVRDRLGGVSHQAVYDVLDALTAAGLVRRIQPSGSVARYEARVRDSHHHVVCRSCGAIADVDCIVGHAPCLSGRPTHGYDIDEAEIIFWGRCSACSHEPSPDPHPHRKDIHA